MPNFNIVQLNSKSLPELTEIAKELGLTKIDSSAKDALVYRILDEQAIQNASRKAAQLKDINPEDRRKRTRIPLIKEKEVKVYTANDKEAKQVKIDKPQVKKTDAPVAAIENSAPAVNQKETAVQAPSEKNAPIRKDGKNQGQKQNQKPRPKLEKPRRPEPQPQLFSQDPINAPDIDQTVANPIIETEKIVEVVQTPVAIIETPAVEIALKVEDAVVSDIAKKRGRPKAKLILKKIDNVVDAELENSALPETLATTNDVVESASVSTKEIQEAPSLQTAGEEALAEARRLAGIGPKLEGGSGENRPNRPIKVSQQNQNPNPNPNPSQTQPQAQAQNSAQNQQNRGNFQRQNQNRPQRTEEERLLNLKVF